MGHNILWEQGIILEIHGDIDEAANDYTKAIFLLNSESSSYSGGTYGRSARHFGSNYSAPASYNDIGFRPNTYFNTSTELTNSANYSSLVQNHYTTDTSALSNFSSRALASTCWVAARAVHIHPEEPFVSYQVCYEYISGPILPAYLYSVYEDGTLRADKRTYALAPVVSLQSGIKVSNSSAGTKSNPWKLTN